MFGIARSLMNKIIFKNDGIEKLEDYLKGGKNRGFRHRMSKIKFGNKQASV